MKRPKIDKGPGVAHLKFFYFFAKTFVAEIKTSLCVKLIEW